MDVHQNAKTTPIGRRLMAWRLADGWSTTQVAAAFGVTEIPTNVLIGRDGTVIHLDLSRKNLAQMVAKAVAR